MHSRVFLSLTALAGVTILASCETPDDASMPGSEGALVATTRASGGGGTRTAYEMAGDPEGIVCRNGRLYYLKDRGTTLLTRRAQRVTAELSIEANGHVSLADGRRMKLRNGDMVTRSGELREAPPYLR